MDQLLPYFLIFLAHIYLAVEPVQGKFRLQILHNNDLQSRFEEMDENTAPCPPEYVEHKKCYGGFARMKRAVDDARQDAFQRNVPSIFLNAGDNFSENPYYAEFKWKPGQELIDQLGFDAIALGNREFQGDIKDFVEFLNVIKTPVLCSNLDTTKEPDYSFSKLSPSKTLTREFEGKEIVIGVIGYTSKEWKLGNINVLDRIKAIRAEAQRLRKEKNAKFIIALGHAGFEEDIKIAQEVTEINLVVGGESQFLLYSPKDKAPSVEKAKSEYPRKVMVGKKDKEEEEEKLVMVPVVQAYAYGKYLGVLEVEFDDNGHVVEATGNPKLLNSEVEKDGHLDEEVSQWANKLAGKIPNFKKIISQTRTSLEKPYYGGGKFESNLANLVTDAFIDWGVQLAKQRNDPHWTKSPISFYPAGGLRVNIDRDRIKGALTVEDLMTILPFQQPMFEITVTGKSIRDFLEYNLSLYDDEGSEFEGRHFIHYSGLRVKFDLAKPYQQRVVSVEALCRECDIPEYLPLEDDKSYGIITQLSEARKFETKFQSNLEKMEHKIKDIEVLINYVTKSKVISPYLDNRVVVDGFDPNKRPSLPDEMEIDKK